MSDITNWLNNYSKLWVNDIYTNEDGFLDEILSTFKEFPRKESIKGIKEKFNIGFNLDTLLIPFHENINLQPVWYFEAIEKYPDDTEKQYHDINSRIKSTINIIKRTDRASNILFTLQHQLNTNKEAILTAKNLINYLDNNILLQQQLLPMNFKESPLYIEFVSFFTPIIDKYLFEYPEIKLPQQLREYIENIDNYKSYFELQQSNENNNSIEVSAENILSLLNANTNAVDYMNLPVFDFLDIITGVGSCNLQIGEIEVYNYFEKSTSNFNKSKVEIVLDNVENYYTTEFKERLIEESKEEHKKNNWEIPTLPMDKAFSEFFEEHLGVNKTHVPDYNKMLEKTHKYDCSGFFIGYALKLLRSKIDIEKETGQKKINNKKVEVAEQRNNSKSDNKTNQDEHLDIFTQNKGGYKLYLKLKGELGNVINDFAYIFRKLQETGYIIGHIEYYYFQEWLKKEFGIDHIGKKYHTLSGLHTIAKDKICNPIIEEHTKINSIQ